MDLTIAGSRLECGLLKLGADIFHGFEGVVLEDLLANSSRRFS
jgi:hypothetical protein